MPPRSASLLYLVSLMAFGEVIVKHIQIGRSMQSIGRNTDL